MSSLAPAQLAARQLELDRQRTSRFPEVLKRKLTRMSASPLAFLRGAATLFYEVLRDEPSLAAGPAAEGWLVGDAHLENYGAFAIAPSSALARGHKRSVIFDLNDFDEAVHGPLHWDVLRLTTSLILAARELGVNGLTVLDLCDRLITSYSAAAAGDPRTPSPPQPVMTLVERAQLRSRQKLLDDRSAVFNGQRRFVRGERYRELLPELTLQVPKALADYANGIDANDRPTAEQLEIIDCAFRVAGTGSLGSLRIAVLTRGKGGVDGGWIFDLKEQLLPSAAVILGSRPEFPSAVTACIACLQHPPRMFGGSTLTGLPMVGRRLSPQEDKLDLRQLKADALAPLASYLGVLLGHAHAKGRGEPAPAWSRLEQTELLERAVMLASLHEAVYLELCLLLRKLPSS